MKRDSVSIGIIGTGFARKVQIPAFQACEDAKVVSVASGTLDHARDTAEEFGIAHYTGDWRDTVSREDVDLVCITTPPKLHYEITLAAIENRKHVLCEKPMAMNVREAKEMTAAARKAGVLAIIDHELRFQPGRQHVFRLLREGGFGKIRHAKCYFQAPHRGDPTVAWNWWSDSDQGGGALGAIGSHVIDSLQWFLGTTVSNVFCQLQSHIKQRPDAAGNLQQVTSDDESLLILRLADGELTEDATGLVSVSMTEIPKYRHRVEFYGTEGAIAIEARGEVYVAMRGDTDWERAEVAFGMPISGVPDTGFSSGFTEFAPKMVDAVTRGHKSIEQAATFEDGLRVQAVMDSAREADRTGCMITVPSF